MQYKQEPGASPSALLAQAEADSAAAAHKRAEFVASAVAARQRMLDTGEGYAADEVHAWLQAKVASTLAVQHFKLRPTVGCWRSRRE